jgi:hypothetical protein
MNSNPTRFRPLSAQLGYGQSAPPGWRAIAEVRLLILVGVTGVGKSTTLERVMAAQPCTLLPDRRLLTDDLIIAEMQARDPAQINAGPVKDRKLRFEYTRRYRQLYPGGMAHALAQLWLAPEQGRAFEATLYIFDGLRGDNEVAYAAGHLPLACFAMLDAPDAVRLRRLLGRGDAFDQIALTPAAQNGPLTTFADLGIQETGGLFNAVEEAALLGLVRSGAVSADDLRAKLQIVIEERRNYDPAATRQALIDHAGSRALIIDTTQHPPRAVAQQILENLP